MSRIVHLFRALTPRERRLFIGAACVVAIAALIFGINRYYVTTSPEPLRGGSFAEGIVGQPTLVNPLLAQTDPDRDMVALLFAPLGKLASISATDDKRVWNVTLKEGVRWSDGEAMGSRDIIFTMERILALENISPLYAAWQGVIAERLSDREARLTTRNPYAFFGENLASLRIAPRHIFEAVPPQNMRLSEYNLKPVGSGPYRFREYRTRKDGFITDYVLERNPYYAGSESLIEEFRVRFFESLTEALAAFNQKKLDGIGGVRDEDMTGVRVGFELFEVPTTRVYAVFMNQTLSVPLKEKAVRQALYQAVDPAALVATALSGKGEVASGPLPPSVKGFSADAFLNLASTSPEAAAAVLEKAGWKIGEDGVREKTIQKNKTRLEFDLITPKAPFLEEAAKTLVAAWEATGVRVTVSAKTPSEVAEQAIRSRNYQLLLFGMITSENPDAFSFWHSSQKFYPGLNLALYENKSVDKLLESVRQNFDEESRGADLAKLQKLIAEDYPAVFLFSPHYLYLASKSLGGFAPGSIAISSDRFKNVEEWHLKTARVFK